ncbi:MAG: sugar phosphate isomerase/epimerase [Acidobacteria bacterium]|nr:sugar phosphate isomerase/epimerase [Acidobacteriota bacterium]MBI3421479.1 sugar phosphate isomerase/epimerase [Acidobacteriota bacterium]
MTEISRRDFVKHSAVPLAMSAMPPSLFANTTAPLSKMGIASTSFTTPPTSGNPAQPGTGTVPRPQGRSAYDFLEKCYALGAGGIQTGLNGDLPKLRARAEELGMYLEGMVSIPRNGDMSALEKGLADAKAAGVKVVRAAMLGGRRYETFPTLAEWKKWVDQSYAALTAALPIIEKHKVIVAVENHKDWTLEDFQKLLRTYQSEYLQVCLDFGNNISLLDDPLEVIEKLAPYAKATHIKDMGVQPYADGFLLSEVPLGTGLLDLPKIVATIQKANPNTTFSLEMMTRDPLKVPCMTKAYWEVFPDRNGKYLAQTFKLVQTKSSHTPLPVVANLSRPELIKIEEDNVKACFRYVSEQKLIA